MVYLLQVEKGRNLGRQKTDIPKLAEKHYNLSSSKIDKLLYASRMAAKIDNVCNTRWLLVIPSCNSFR